METMPKQLPPAFAHLAGKAVTIVAFGDSNTQQMHWTYGYCNWVGLLSMGLFSVFPEGALVINAGKSGDTMAKGLARLERDVLRFDPEVVIFGFGTNDSSSTTPEQFRAETVEAIRRIRARRPETVIVLRTQLPILNMYTGAEEELVRSNGRELTIADRRAFVQVTREVAAAEHTLLVDHYESWRRSTESSCRGDLCALLGNPAHPNHLGHRRLYHEIAPLFSAYPHFFFEWERVLRDQDRLSFW